VDRYWLSTSWTPPSLRSAVDRYWLSTSWTPPSLRSAVDRYGLNASRRHRFRSARSLSNDWNLLS